MSSLLRGNHYEVLNLKPGATPEQLEKAFRVSLSLYTAEPGDEHEDAASAARDRLREAYDVLRDPERRSEYDRLHGFPPPPTDPSVGVPRPVFPMREPKPRPVAKLPTHSNVPDSFVPRARREGPLPTAATGAEMKAAREKNGVKLEDIAAVTKVTRRMLEDIENERHDRLPAPVYVRAFLQQYATLVGLDPKTTAEAYMARIPRRA